MDEHVAKREKKIVFTSVIGIVVNLALAGMKALIGLFSNSIAIILDAVNNLSDAMSSVVTIIGAKLGALPPSKKHPFGYGRVEYLSSMLVSAIVMYAGITSLVESIKKIITPEEADYGMVTLILLGVAVVVKIFLGLFVKRQGKSVQSNALVASGTEALLDAVLSVAVLASAGVYLIWGISIEAYVGLILAIIIIKAGVELMLETLDDILGKRMDRDEIHRIKKTICEEEAVRGAYDLMLHNYGPDKNYGSVHIELPDRMSVSEVDELSRRVQERVYRETGVTLTGISVYSHNTRNAEASLMQEAVQKAVLIYGWALQMHGFYVDMRLKKMRFDIVLSFEIERDRALQILQEDVKKLYPDYDIVIVPDVDV